MSNISSIFVPHAGKIGSSVLLVGEAPGGDEEFQKQPFVGLSGELLTNCLGRNGVLREEIFLANLSHYRPAGNRFELLNGTKELSDGIDELRDYILRWKPNIIGALGGQALFHLTGVSNKITKWRGSILPCKFDSSIKVVATYHPAYVLRDRTHYPVFDLDIKRIIGEREEREFNLPEREFIIDPRGLELEEITQELCAAPKISVDIESVKARKKNAGHKNFILCAGFATSSTRSVCIVNHGDNQFTSSVQRILESPAKKIFHFGTFDTEVFHINGFETNNYWWDTLTAQHILAPELPRSLDFLSSIYTREPYYKTVGRGEIPDDTKSWSEKVDKEKLWIYNCRDTGVTFEIQEEQEKELTGRDLEMFRYEMDLIPVAQTMARNGLLVDQERLRIFDDATTIRWYKLQGMIDALCEKHVNVYSPKQLQKVLYEDLNLPVRRNRDGSVTTDEDAIVGLIAVVADKLDSLVSDKSKFEWNIKYAVLKAILEIRGLRKLRSTYLRFDLSNDGRVRSLYKFSNTDTGRGAAEQYVDATGINSQTFPRSSVEIPDELLVPEAAKSLLLEASEDEGDARDDSPEILGEDLS